MPRWSKPQESARQSIIALASSSLPVNELAQRIMAELRGAVGWDGYRLFGVDHKTLLINRLLAASDNDDWARSEFLSEVYLAADPLHYIELPYLMRAKLPAVAFQARQDQCWGYSSTILSALKDTHHTQQFHEQRSPVGGSLLASFSGDGRWIACLQAYRREHGTPFRSTDVAFVHALARTIGDALSTAMSRQQRLQGSADSGAGSPGIVHVSATGNPEYASPAGETWLEVLRTTDGRPQSLPTACLAAIASVQQHSPPEDALMTSVTVDTLKGIVRIEASAIDENGGIALAFRPGHNRNSRTLLPTEWPLTPRERDVVGCVIDGHRNRSIARALSMGEHTVEGHLRQAYGKMEVRSRSQLVARWFRETQLPTIQLESSVPRSDLHTRT